MYKIMTSDGWKIFYSGPDSLMNREIKNDMPEIDWRKHFPQSAYYDQLHGRK